MTVFHLWVFVPVCLLKQGRVGGGVGCRGSDEQRSGMGFEEGSPEWPVLTMADLHDD